jgi:hypothetical protein
MWFHFDRSFLDSFTDDSFSHEFFLEIFEEHSCLHKVIKKCLENTSGLCSCFVEFSPIWHGIIGSQESILKNLRQLKSTIPRSSTDELDILERDFFIFADIKVDDIIEREDIPSFIESIDGKYRSYPIGWFVEIREGGGIFFDLAIVDHRMLRSEILSDALDKGFERNIPIRKFCKKIAHEMIFIVFDMAEFFEVSH